MNIITLIKGNIARTPQTQRFPGREAPAAAYRGSVAMDPSKCLACGICDYVCVSRAIKVTPGEGRCEWTYDPGRCTFCGRCVDHCPGEAVTQDADRGDSYSGSGSRRVSVTVPYPACPECGKAAPPFSEALLGAAFGEISAELRKRVDVCDRCRQRATGATMKASFGAATETRRDDDER